MFGQVRFGQGLELGEVMYPETFRVPPINLSARAFVSVTDSETPTERAEDPVWSLELSCGRHVKAAIGVRAERTKVCVRPR